MKVDVRYFGSVADATNCSNEMIEMDESQTIEALNSKLIKKYPNLKNMDYKLSCNKELASNNDIIEDGSEIALLPPFAGG